jgi:histidine ammonia-lyase
MDAVVLTGSDLTIAEVLAVARRRTHVEISSAALERMSQARDVAERAVERGAKAYGVTTGVGSRKSFAADAPGHDRLLVRQHVTAQGSPAAHEIVRAMALRLANALASGTTVARPALAQLVVDALNADRLPVVRSLGSIGLSDLAQMADLADGILGNFELARGEGIALLNQASFSTAYGAIAFADAVVLLDTLDAAGALDLEAFGANPGVLHPRVGDVRPYPGLQSTLVRLRALLAGSEVEARALQDPVSFRTLAHVNGGARDALDFVGSQITIELNAAQSNPLVLIDEEQVISVGNFEIQPFASALDFARLALAPVITSAAERAVKLLQAPLTGLPEGLGARPALAESALSEFGIAVQAFAAEARGGWAPGAARGPDDDGAARCATARGDGRARGARCLDRTAPRCPGVRPPRLSTRHRHRRTPGQGA